MGIVVRQLLLLAAATALTWWLLGVDPRPPAAQPAPRSEELEVAVVAALARAAEVGESIPSDAPSPAEPEPPAPAVDAEQQVEALDAPPPAELGDPDGVEGGELPQPDPPVVEERSDEPLEDARPEPSVEEPLPSSPAEPLAEFADELDPGRADAAESAEPVEPNEAVERSVAGLMQDEELLEAARREIDGDVRRGFATVLLAAPEDQLDIARAFGEEIVLVPKAALDPDAERPRWFRLELDGEPRVTTVFGPPPLERYRQYRDLFDYEYARLPTPLRELRRSVLVRSDVYLFAALIPPAEWAVVVGRRREALASSGRDVADVRRVEVRTVRTASGHFDVRVEEIVFTDGTRYQPSETLRQP